ncbi:MAG: pyridoxamine 5'-phosphate oxidase family protein [Thermoanaerobaculia bacterium]|nr:pyridoxamine 5'-phosphate oxidase family protein [Thermoanaerobaculia bacterium]
MGAPGKLAPLLEGLVAVHVATRDAALVPDEVMAAAALLEPDGRSLTVYLPDATSATALANLRENGQIAVVLSQPLTHRTVQLKGRVETIRPAGEDEREAVERFAAAFDAEVAAIGLPPAALRRRNRWPCTAATFAVREGFEQTPGPRAGEPLVAEGAP